jgi:hypothetical protein
LVTGNGQQKLAQHLHITMRNGNFKPLPFNFTRSTSATRVNKDGLIEMVTNNKPRIDFLNDSNGALLLEPQRTNLVQYSEDFSNAYWTKSGSSVVSGFTSPDGTANAFKMTEDSATSVHKISNNSAIANSFQSQSIFIKYDSSQQFIQTTSSRSINNYVNFDILNKTLTNYGTSVGKIVELSSGWLRLEVYHDSSTTAYWHFITSLTASWSESYLGTGKHLLIFGAQVEAGSYPTSYIPTQGATVTRVAESCSQTPPSGIIGQTEGVIYLQVGLINNNNSTNATKWFMEIRKDANNSFGIGSGGADVAPTIRFVTKISGVASTDAEPAGFSNSKIAIQYTSSNFKIYQNGSLKATINKNIGNYSEIEFMQGAAVDLKMPIKDFRVYNTVLTDAELIALTT